MTHLSKSQAAARLKELRRLINDYRYHYHVLDESIMSEAAADSLKHELTELETANPELVTPDSPSQRVAGKPLPGFKQVRHNSRMLSLNDVFSREEVEAWIGRLHKLEPSAKLEFFVDIKMDGLACALIYEDGEFKQAVTRGDGYIGEDVTENVKTIENVPLKLRHNKKYENFLIGTTEIRGEIIMHKKDFDNLNKQRAAAGQPAFANPRNLAAGSIRQLDPKLAAGRPLRFRAYDLIRNDFVEVPTYQTAYEALRALGVSSNSQALVVNNIEKIIDYVNAWEIKRSKLPFNTDGLVIKVNDRNLYSNLGVVGKAPRAAVAFKYAAEETTTVVLDIVLSIGRTGAATPVAVFNPVVVAGTTVQHASLHNADEIARKDIRVGDTVIIFKAGEIIPQVSRVIKELRPKNSKPFNMVAELKRQYPELSFVRPAGEVVYRLKGATGKLLLKQALGHFASKAALDIDTLGEKNVAALVDAKLVHSLADIYTLTKEQVLSLERFAEISTDNLLNAIADAKHPELPRFIYGLGIRHVGTQTAIDLAEHFGSLGKLAAATPDDLMAVAGIGDVVAESILAWFADPDNQKLLDEFERLGVKPVFESHLQGRLHGQNIVVTGTLDTMSRDEAAAKIRSLGGTFQTAVGQDTTYLVVGSGVGETKLKKARELGTKQISEKELTKLLT